MASHDPKANNFRRQASKLWQPGIFFCGRGYRAHTNENPEPEFQQNKRQNFKREQRSHKRPQVFWRSRPFSVLTEASDAGSSDAYHSAERLFLTPTRSLPASNANAHNYSLR